MAYPLCQSILSFFIHTFSGQVVGNEMVYFSAVNSDTYLLSFHHLFVVLKVYISSFLLFSSNKLSIGFFLAIFRVFATQLFQMVFRIIYLAVFIHLGDHFCCPSLYLLPTSPLYCSHFFGSFDGDLMNFSPDSPLLVRHYFYFCFFFLDLLFYFVNLYLSTHPLTPRTAL